MARDRGKAMRAGNETGTRAPESGTTASTV